MPIYEYRCQACDKLSSFFLKSMNPDEIGMKGFTLGGRLFLRSPH